ncbi:glycosyltransferase family 4 protein [Serratia proteamaculans]|uniref:glycosyltransferase family 4 protein n=1 Tax=Serratia proteamaculans TaxID=28151 RepID=UPI00217C0797|nr:glycosyltransferase family 1 protein [Serratia proteamaculans]CAI1722123.1 Glycogen synthase [Serratia proteamaculans]
MIYINARFLTQDVTGVQRFAEQICIELVALRDDVVLLAPKDIKRSSLPAGFNIQTIGEKSGHFWEQVELPKYLRSIGSPVLVNLCSTAPVFYKNQIVTHHDVTYKRYKKSFSLKFRILYSLLIPMMLKSSKALITVSEFSKSEILQYFKYDPKKIHIIYNAVGNEFVNSSKESDKLDKYFLAVSSPNFHKNFHGMLEAYSLYRSKHGGDIKLKVIGKSASSFATQDFSKNAQDGDVTFLGRVDDNELITLYQNATAFVFPSFYEGFGIPPLEAQACGCPVISSNKASMPEVLRNSVLYFDPYNVAEIANTMEKIISDSALRDTLMIAGLENVKSYSWKSSAEKVNAIIETTTSSRA